MDYDQIDVLDKGTVWQGGALATAGRWGISADDALARIRAQRPIADPNPGVLAQLQRLWPR
jgi:hypothetical protein